MARITISGAGPDAARLASIARGSADTFTWLPIEGAHDLPAPTDATRIDHSVKTVLDHAERSAVRYVGPGAPLGDDPVADALVRECRARALDVELIEAPPLWWANRPEGETYSVIFGDDIDEADLSRTCIVTGIVGAAKLQEVASRLRLRSQSLRLRVAPWNSSPSAIAPAAEIDPSALPTPLHPCSVVTAPLAAMDEPDSIRSLLEIVARLRAPDGCPWDREQTHESLRRHMVEEAYEAVEAIDDGGGRELAAELGDVLVQVALHSQIASESGEFTFADVVSSISTKLVRRHPHVFDNLKLEGADEVLSNWERIKAGERGHEDFLEGVPKSLPSLAYARAAWSRAERLSAGMPDNDFARNPLDAFEGWLEQVPESQRETALGQFMLALVRIATAIDLDPELALAGENRRFRERVRRSLVKPSE
ncbi:MAG: MazG family protein [Chloroflexi bacterium]|nr:MazG family protein [Chloroflexota bacterium]MCY3938537.1 MazG family protein [Chloroflexota bacterium]